MFIKKNNRNKCKKIANYILTSGKTGTDTLNYTLYAEQPLDIVSVS